MSFVGKIPILAFILYVLWHGEQKWDGREAGNEFLNLSSVGKVKKEWRNVLCIFIIYVSRSVWHGVLCIMAPIKCYEGHRLHNKYEYKLWIYEVDKSRGVHRNREGFGFFTYE